MAYGFSVFWLPLSKSTGWTISTLGWLYTMFFVFLGLSAALFGPWIEKAGPRKTGFVSAICWSGSFLIAALGVYTTNIWLLLIGSGVIGGIGLGLGYISPVSTLIKWFPDRRGLATGMAIMGFGGGAMIGSPLANHLMNYFTTETSAGIWETFLVFGAIYFVFMMLGAFSYRLPASDLASVAGGNAGGTDRYVPVELVHKTPQFWLLWTMLCMNVGAGIGVIGMASPMLQEIFAGNLIGVDTSFSNLGVEQKKQISAIGAAFVGLLSLFNILGRIAWSSFSDSFGRKMTYYAFFLLGFLMYATVANSGSIGLLPFVLVMLGIMTMYGGGFATIPAYLSDLFGTKNVGAIHGRLLTAWSVAGILGPVLVNYLREYQLAKGIPQQEVYSMILYILAALLIVGYFCNYLVKPVNIKWTRPAVQEGFVLKKAVAVGTSFSIVVILAWASVLIPLLWGVYQTLVKVAVFFH
jgi:MFS family permease